MTIKLLEKNQRIKRNLAIGEATSLDASLPCGLFKADSGNRYIIGRHLRIPFALALCHRDWPEFTYRALSSEPIERGRWWGPWEIQLTHEVPDYSFHGLGCLSIIAPDHLILCRDSNGDGEWLILGDVDMTEPDHANYDGWSIRPLNRNVPFFSLLPDRDVRLRIK